MATYVHVFLDLTQEVTLNDVREFVRQAERVGVADDQELRKHNDDGDLTDLEGIGGVPSDASE
ncbi:hypothetical protein SAMN05216207_104638 [Pseudonocardia ammonioxydans]|uniref:Uncharacterized protein n=1 Tax=Pseudonocardia ammonioxydans TaxID=260086 RepID=A0A1I5GGF1_PSUAM|nr:hypothetical protein [Pseudonocardia ammonioxydans]SFO34959.1 hypothetical protein SAMN05216207_104638 [Pseudonocardia ammonioxydans]